MRNYIIKNIENPEEPFPDSNDPTVKERLLPLPEYQKIAKKVIRRFAPKYVGAAGAEQMVNSEDAVAEVVLSMAKGDLRFNVEKGRSPRSWRNQCGIYGIQDYLTAMRNTCNTELASLDKEIPNCECRPLDILEDKDAEDPFSFLNNDERKERVRSYVNFVVKHSDLTDTQKKCLNLRFTEGITSLAEIGEKLDPPVSRQNVKQLLDRTLFKLKQTALGAS
jgi:RNA polymerase sigma factor (sigma-70 family)